ncbi:MAG: hypothetical protein Kow00121_24270 [Elainellaceae cyanobacterium]
MQRGAGHSATRLNQEYYFVQKPRVARLLHKNMNLAQRAALYNAPNLFKLDSCRFGLFGSDDKATTTKP